MEHGAKRLFEVWKEQDKVGEHACMHAYMLSVVCLHIITIPTLTPHPSTHRPAIDGETNQSVYIIITIPTLTPPQPPELQ